MAHKPRKEEVLRERVFTFLVKKENSSQNFGKVQNSFPAILRQIIDLSHEILAKKQDNKPKGVRKGLTVHIRDSLATDELNT